MLTAHTIKQEALRLGFDACGIAKPKFLAEDAAYLQNWLNMGYNADMHYMANYFDKRTNPQLLVENAKSVIVVLLNYFPAQKQNPNAPQVAKYAYGEDYHWVMKSKLAQLQDFIFNTNPSAITNDAQRIFCDSAPVLERRWAQRAGLGFIGKNTNLINPQLGSFFFIGELIIDVELDYDQPINNHCGSCTRCLEACPTNALLAPRKIDARKCISYQTIEKKGDIDAEIMPLLSSQIFGCDICQDVCPWNKKAKANEVQEFVPDNTFLSMDWELWKNLDKSTFNLLFKKSPIKRAGYEKLKSSIRVIQE